MKKTAKMTSKNTDLERRSKVAEACLDFGAHLLRVRTSSVTADDAKSVVKDLFEWFASQNAFSEANTGIAIHAIGFGEQLLESRKSATLDEATEAIQKLYVDLSA